MANMHGDLVLNQYIDALNCLKENIPKNLPFCIEKIKNTKGRIVCVGVGKSAFIIQKIGSCLASIGIATQFLDPTHAAHGDLGGLRKEDMLFAASYSGESSELFPILSFSKEKSIFSLLMTAFPYKKLGCLACETLCLPVLQEVGSLGCVPSTSSLLMLTIGDMIINALEQDISLTEYQKNHPHGALGFKLTPITQVMKKGDCLPLVDTTTSMTDLLIVMSEKRLGCAGVIDGNGKLVGAISDGDVRRACIHLGVKNMTQYLASNIMKHTPKTLSSDAIINDALALMERHKITFVFIVNEQQKPIGIVHFHDNWKAIR